MLFAQSSSLKAGLSTPHLERVSLLVRIVAAIIITVFGNTADPAAAYLARGTTLAVAASRVQGTTYALAANPVRGTTCLIAANLI